MDTSLNFKVNSMPTSGAAIYNQPTVYNSDGIFFVSNITLMDQFFAKL